MRQTVLESPIFFLSFIYYYYYYFILLLVFFVASHSRSAVRVGRCQDTGKQK